MSIFSVQYIYVLYTFQCKKSIYSHASDGVNSKKPQQIRLILPNRQVRQAHCKQAQGKIIFCKKLFCNSGGFFKFY